ncbi:hypothetical protein DSO57_1004441 [Entomophthora muscae]|uniref:Uncharacterized protein n=1 Tax=Entomophthora muscae TaxID=34485 RepID=A0ACC2UH63_9FUNG|nr:hypothetical protein DSO57_1004441 [Entomophthora muscae]
MLLSTVVAILLTQVQGIRLLQRYSFLLTLNIMVEAQPIDSKGQQSTIETDLDYLELKPDIISIDEGSLTDHHIVKKNNPKDVGGYEYISGSKTDIISIDQGLLNGHHIVKKDNPEDNRGYECTSRAKTDIISIDAGLITDHHIVKKDNPKMI